MDDEFSVIFGAKLPALCIRYVSLQSWNVTLAGSGVQNLWFNGVQISCVKASPVKRHANSNYMGSEKYM